MPYVHSKPSELAYFQEVTQGTPPADAAAWQSETRIRHIAESLDVSGLTQAVVEDMRSQTRINAIEQKVRGLKNVEFPFQLYATGSGTATTDGQQIAAIDLGTILAHCMGGESRNNTTTVSAGSSASQFTLTANTNYAAGQLLSYEDANGVNFVRRITALSGSDVTIDEDLEATPSMSDVVNAMATYHIDETVLVDSNGGPYTLSWFIRKGGVGSDIEFVTKGCKTELRTISLTRGELPILEFNTMAASFDGPTDAPSPTWASAVAGNAPTAIGPTTDIFLQDYGTTTSNIVKCAEVSIECGLPVSQIPTLTEAEDNMEGVGGYSFTPSDTLITLTLGPWDESYNTDFEAGTFKVFRWTKRDDAGNLFCFMCPRCEVVEGPTPNAASGDVWGNKVVLRAHEDLDATGTTELIKSKFLIGIG